MENALIKQKIHDFLSANELAILSTVHFDRSAPESAVVGFGNNEKLELVFGTSTTTRKYRNLQDNPNVSLVIGWSSTLGSLQYEGVAEELDQERLEIYAPLLVEKNENTRQFLTRTDQRYFRITPTWIRFYDNAGSPPEIYTLENF